MYDTLIIGGGVSGMSCALVLESAVKKPFVANKKSESLLIKKHLRYKKRYLIMPMEFQLGL